MKYVIITLLCFISATFILKPDIIFNNFNRAERYVVHVDDEFTKENLQDALRTLEIADGNDTVDIFVNSPGGQISSMVMLIEAINTSLAKVNYRVAQDAFSAAAITMCNIDPQSVHLNHYSLVVFHQPRISNPDGSIILMTDILKDGGEDVEFAKSALATMDACTKFLTKDEIQAYMDGKDVYITGDEFNKRLSDVIKSQKVSKQVNTLALIGIILLILGLATVLIAVLFIKKD